MYTKYKNEHKLRQAIKDDHLTHLVSMKLINIRGLGEIDRSSLFEFV